METHRVLHSVSLAATNKTVATSVVCIGIVTAAESGTLTPFHPSSLSPVLFPRKGQCRCFRCLTGNIAEFKLKPRWGQNSNAFGCHVQPVSGYSVYDVEFYASVKVVTSHLQYIVQTWNINM